MSEDVKYCSDMRVECIDHMGDDLRVSNVARVSFNKWKEELSDKDAKLINFLAEHEHTSPFRHCFASFRIKAPIFVARQLVKHQVGLSWNEVSRRYVDDTPELYVPDSFRRRAENKKQGSSDEAHEDSDHFRGAFIRLCWTAIGFYEGLINMGVAPEQARSVLPQSVMTEWIWSGSLQAFAHICNLRCAPDAQLECRMVADMIDAEMKKLFPNAWAALRA